MSHSGNDVWEASDEVYTEAQIESVLDKIDVEVVGETDKHFSCFCPFHDNTDSPAFLVNKIHGASNCLNPSCDFSGSLDEMVRKVLKCTPFKALMLIIKSKTDDEVPYAERRRRIMESAPGELKEFSQDTLDTLYANFKGSPGQTYMYGRGFEDETLEYFKIGYAPAREYPSPRPEMVTVPMHDIKGRPIGLIGRSIQGKEFKNSKGLPKKYTAWNIHRAKREGDTVIIVEASFDAMRVHQAGYPNVIALLGGHVSPFHLDQIERHFSQVVVMTDYERGDDLVVYENCRKCEGNCIGHMPGRDLGRKIIKGLSEVRTRWAAYDDTCVYPHGAKDVGGMTDDEIRQCIQNAIPNGEYNRWNIESVLR